MNHHKKNLDEASKKLNQYLMFEKGRPHLEQINEYSSSTPESPASIVGPSDADSSIQYGIKPDKLETLTSINSRKDAIKKYRYINMSSVKTQTIFDAKITMKSAFFGFWTLAWTLVFIGTIRELLFNHLDYGQPMGKNIFRILRSDLEKVALLDIIMYLMSYFGFFLQLAIKNNYLTWNSGWIIQSIHQIVFLFSFLWLSVHLKLPWIGRVFLFLHSLVFIMKQHSYAFYNGHFWTILKELHDSTGQLAKNRENLSQEDIDQWNQSISFCEDELNMQSDTCRFPNNITFENHFWYTMFPTLVYQIEYPRNNGIRWSYFAKKVAAVFGVMFLMIFLAEQYLYPIAVKSMSLRDYSFHDKLKAYPRILLELIPPFALMYQLVFYIIWDAILNAIAELTQFADRGFYGSWWNCVSWDEFAKLWNVPVHRFLLRHVYHSSISSMHFTKGQATFFTFLLSSCVHELAMFVIFGKLRGYLLLLQMFQLPLVALSRSRFLRNKPLLGNIVFWFGICTGPGIMCSLYLTF